MPAFAPRPLWVAMAPLLLAVAAAHATENTPTEAAVDDRRPDTTLDTLVVVGNRGAKRAVVESLVPIDVISGADLLKQGGSTDLRDALSRLLPSFNVATITGTVGYSNAARPASLRGFGGGYLLVLVNGKRRHVGATQSENNTIFEGFGAADLDFIPISAVDRVEVLRDGAAAQYGSDAVAGVVNIILKRDSEGVELTTMAGKRLHYSGDVDADGETVQQTIGYGRTLGEDGFLHLALDAKRQEPTRRPIPATQAFYWPINGQPDPREATVNKMPVGGGLPETTRITASWNAGLPLASGADFYSHGTLSKRDATVGIGFRTVTSPSVIPELYPDGTTADFIIKETDYQFTAGVNGTSSNQWAWDASASYGANDMEHHSDKNVNASLGPASPTEFFLQGNELGLFSANLDLTRRFGTDGPVPFDFSWGLEYRREDYRTRSGDPLSYVNGGYVFPNGPLAGQLAQIGALGNNLMLPEDESDITRNVQAAYLEGGLELTPRWDVDLAARYERYSDSAGSTFNGKIATRYEFSEDWALRGSASTGFVAPSLIQQGYAKTGLGRRTIDGVVQDVMIKQVQVDSPIGRALGATDLTPIESTQYALGLTWSPTRTFNVALDAYVIELNDRIANITPLSGAGVDAILAANGFSHVQQVRYYANGFDTRTRGVDLVIESRHGLGDWGNLRWSAGFNYNKTEIVGLRPNPPELQSMNLILFRRTELGGVTNGTPKTKGVLGLNWNYGDLDIGWRTSYYGETRLLGTAAIYDEVFGGKWISDLDVSYRFSDAVSVSIGADNVFNVYPDRRTAIDTSGNSVFSPISPFGSYGGFYYARLSLAF